MPRKLINGAHLYYAVYEQNGGNTTEKNTIVFLPGGAGMVDHTLYLSFWSQFKAIATLIFVDPRGCGASDDGDDKAKWLINNQAKDIYALCQSLNVKKPIIAGVSWGGYIALSYAIQYPQALGALILCNTEAKINSKYRQDKFFELGGEAARKAVADLDQRWSWTVNTLYLKTCLPFYAQKNPYTLEELAAAGRKNKKLYEQFFTKEHNTFDFMADLRNITVPVLQLIGGKDPVHPKASALETAKALTKAKLQSLVFANAGDTVYRDEPEAVSAAIRKFCLGLSVFEDE
ncbi:MAG: alpha/beta hydrolase [Pseudomonadota bacterium]